MKKLKIFLAVVAALGMVLLCANLPRLTATFIDAQAGNSPVYNDIHSVELELKEEKDMLPIFGKLSLCATGETAYIEEFHAQKTEKEIKDYVYTFMDACQRAGFYQNFTPSTEVVRTWLLYDVGDPSNAIVIWTYFAFLGDPCQELEIMIDDETGKILSLAYEIYNVPYSTDGIWERNRKIVEPLADLYFEHLGLSEYAEAAEAAPGTLYRYMEIDFGVTDVYYTLSDPTYGTLEVLFDVGGAGTFRVHT